MIINARPDFCQPKTKEIHKIFENEFKNITVHSSSSKMTSYRCETDSRETVFSKIKNILENRNIKFEKPTSSSISFGFEFNINDRKYRYFLKPIPNKKSKELKAEDFEIVVCVVNNLRFTKTIEEAYELSKANSTNKEKILDVAMAYKDSLLKSFEKYSINEPILVTPRSGDMPTEKWVNLFNEGGGTRVNNTPKTDIFSESGRYKISVKKGGAQLISSGVGETYATFKVATEGNVDDVLLDEIKKNMKKFSDSPSIKDIKKLKKSNLTESQTLIYEAITNHKDLKNKISKYLSNNKGIRTNVAFEAMTGTEKFGINSLSTANYLLRLSDTGDEILKFAPIDKSLASKYSEMVKIDLTFKSSGKNKWSSFRMIIP